MYYLCATVRTYTRYNYKYNYNCLSDTTIHYFAYKLFVGHTCILLCTKLICSNTQLISAWIITESLIVSFCLFIVQHTFSLTNLLEMEGSRSRLENSFFKPLVYVHSHTFLFLMLIVVGLVNDVFISVYVFVYTLPFTNVAFALFIYLILTLMLLLLLLINSSMS